MVQIGDGSFSRELCGGTHVRSTAEIGVFRLTAETSSAANVRRIEALTGPGAVGLLRSHDALLRDAGRLVRKRPEEVPAAIEDLQAKAKQAAKGAGSGPAVDVDVLAGQAVAVDGVQVLTAQLPPMDPKSLPDLADKLKGRLGDSVVVLGTAPEGRVALVAAVAQAVVDRGVRAGDVVKEAAQVVGGGGGGKPTMAQAGGKDPSKLGDALDRARAVVESALSA
jgi:alanyl-tRNA synthetase